MACQVYHTAKGGMPSGRCDTKDRKGSVNSSFSRHGMYLRPESAEAIVGLDIVSLLRPQCDAEGHGCRWVDTHYVNQHPMVGRRGPRERLTSAQCHQLMVLRVREVRRHKHPKATPIVKGMCIANFCLRRSIVIAPQLAHTVSSSGSICLIPIWRESSGGHPTGP